MFLMKEGIREKEESKCVYVVTAMIEVIREHARPDRWDYH